MTTLAVCENCERGYSPASPVCQWCGAGGWLSFAEDRVPRTMDTECYPDYWLCKVDPPFEGVSDFQLFPGHPLDRDKLVQMASRSQLVSFNGDDYDIPMLTLALTGADNATLKRASDLIIKGGLRRWQFYQHFNLVELTWLDHIDLIEIMPGQYSLKAYGGKMHAQKIQDLPFDPDESIDWCKRHLLREYCGNDLNTTWMARKQFDAEIQLREQMSEEYGIDLRSKSDAQMAEAIMKKRLGGYIEKAYFPPGFQFYYKVAPWLRFQRLNVLDILAQSPFTVNEKGGVEEPDALANLEIRIGKSVYRMGIGGLHSTESKVVHLADEIYSLEDFDVASYYPKLILATGICPPAIGAAFQPIYGEQYDTRLTAKRAGNKRKGNSLKTLLNGTFGKTNSKWSIFYDPPGFIGVTVGGQLSILMLIELLEMHHPHIQVVSANTDGIVIRCRRDMHWLRDQIIAYWCKITTFEVESVQYAALCSRDVNNYIAVYADPTKAPKRKGTYAPPVPVATSWPNPTGEICQDAIVEFLWHGTPMEQTIRTCTNVRKFVHVRNVKGGGLWNGEYLGKVVRWYYAAGETGTINYRTNGNKVPDSDGCRPLMELPDSLPGDIDYTRYLADARSMLHDLGVMG